MIQNCLEINDNNHLTIGGLDAKELANEYGTPLIVYDEDTIRKNAAAFKNSISENYINGSVVYASKAFLCKEICRLMNELDIGLDVVSGGELYTALQTDFPSDRLFFHGSNKTQYELEFAMTSNVGTIVVDNMDELVLLNEIAKRHDKKQNIMFRIKPGVEAHTHEFVSTGRIDSKFGFALENKEARAAVEAAISMENLNLIGLHCHIGSQIFLTEPFKQAAETLLSFYKHCRDEYKINFTHLNFGGGYGIKYTENDIPLPFENYMKAIAKTIKNYCSKNGLNEPFVIIEPGRAIVADAAITLYEAGTVKEIKNIRNYISVDGGLTDNPRYSLYGSQYTVLNASRMNEPPSYNATIAGKCCEADTLQENVTLVKPKKGDIIAFCCTGAYVYSMASNYNKTPKPMVIMIKNGKSRVIINRESYEDMAKNDI